VKISAISRLGRIRSKGSYNRIRPSIACLVSKP
jgi:hypothetical protein